MNKREFVKLAGAGVLGAASTVQSLAAASPAVLTRTTPANFILIHGAFHGGWCYDRVAALLREAGHKVWNPSLSGMAEHAHSYSPAINLSTHINDVVNLIDVEDIHDAVLCGHSYGGMVVTGALDRRPKAIRSIVYLDAFVPENGQCLFDLDKPEAVRARLNSAASHGGHTISPLPASSFGVNQADQAYVDSKCTSQPLATFSERIVLSGAEKSVAKKMFIRAERWNTPFDAIYEKVQADASFVTHTLPCGHDVMIDMPDRLAQLLVEAI